MTRKRLVCALHHASVRVANLDDAFQRWSHLLGLHGEKISADEAILRCSYEDYALHLRQANDKPFLDYVCYELAPGLQLDGARAILTDRGQEVADIEVPFRRAGIALQDPDSNRVVLIERIRPQDTRPGEVRFSDVIPGWHPRKFGHVNFLTSNVKRQVQWYSEILEFGVTDWIGDEGVWLHVNSDHHVLAFLEKGFDHIHHLAFELVDWGEMRVALDHLAKNQRHLVWGPGRHGMARNLFSYFRMREEEHFIELFCDMEQLSSDHETRHFSDDPHSSNTWGILPPRTYFRFDNAAIEAEEEQAYAYGKPIPAVP
jgi:catechol 2,3-dioxygenase-like lactoylglutathione lyase family enzyme